MKVSEYYHLGRTQPELDFVNVDVTDDARVFVNPRALRLLDTEWGAECRFLIQNCFRHILNVLRTGNEDQAQKILSALREPNETHLGLSQGRARGRALGDGSAVDVAKSLAESTAIRTGLIEDLEDTILMVKGVGPDIISDITTNIIRKPLITYTKAMCQYYGIPLENVASGVMWNPDNLEWYNDIVQQPVAFGKQLLLVPRSIVRLHMDYDPDEYYRLYLLQHLRDYELSANTELVKIIKSTGERVVYNKDLKKKYGVGKDASVRITREHPNALAIYRSNKSRVIGSPLSHLDLAEATLNELPNWDKLLSDVLSTPEGTDEANNYHLRVEKLLSALFSSDLSYPEIETKIHEGRKRIDITYTNAATKGFFKWVGDYAPAPYVFVECKNYSSDIANPELDQISSRFSPRRGRFGLIVCRKLDNKALFLKRCKDTFQDDRGLVIPLDDNDLKILVEQMKDVTRETGSYPLLKQIADNICL